MMARFDQIITVCLNPAVDRILEVPGFTVGSHQRGRQLSRHPAGKAVNVSRALAALGIASTATGFVGSRELGFFEDFLSSSKTNAQFLAVDGITRENVTVIDPIARRETHIRDIGFAVLKRDLQRLKKKLKLMLHPGTLLIFSGSMPPGIEDSDFIDLIETCVSGQARVAIDSSGSAIRAAASLPLWLVKPNVAELAEMVGRTASTERQIAAIGRDLGRRVRVLLVSCGEHGGYAFIDGSTLVGRVDVDRSRVVNTVGCGDCLLAGFVAAQSRGEDARESYRYALAVASAAAVSAEAAQFDIKDVEAFRSAAVVEAVP
jgi:1-phosphofructokinase